MNSKKAKINMANIGYHAAKSEFLLFWLTQYHTNRDIMLPSRISPVLARTTLSRESELYCDSNPRLVATIAKCLVLAARLEKPQLFVDDVRSATYIMNLSLEFTASVAWAVTEVRKSGTVRRMGSDSEVRPGLFVTTSLVPLSTTMNSATAIMEVHFPP